MKEKTKNILNKVDILISIIKIICVIILLIIIGLLLIQRVSNNEKSILGYRVFNVQTESMVPVYEVGDILLVKEVKEVDLKIGDDVTYLGEVGDFSGRVVTHRLKDVEIDENDEAIYHTQGVANEFEDPTIKYNQIYGVVVYKSIFLTMFSHLMNNMTAFYIVIFIPLAILVVLQLRGMFENKNSDEDENEDEDEDDDEEDDDE